MNNRLAAVMTAMTIGSFLASAPTLAAQQGTERGKSTGESTLEQGIGVSGGAVIGALAGGPIGMMVGAGVGVWLGSRVHDARQLDDTQVELQSTQAALSSREQDLDRLTSEQNALRVTLEARERDLERLATLADDAERANEDLRRALASGLEMQVMFRTGASELTEASVAQLERLGFVLSGIADLNVRLDGYADPRGESEYNEMLAAERVASVQQALMRGGLTREQLKGFAHGERHYAEAERDLDAYALARRVDISLTALEAHGDGQGQGDLASVASP
jgi:outer membrane protein OmpA-like peptidoglycan-associated protein